MGRSISQFIDNTSIHSLYWASDVSPAMPSIFIKTSIAIVLLLGAHSGDVTEKFHPCRTVWRHPFSLKEKTWPSAFAVKASFSAFHATGMNPRGNHAGAYVKYTTGAHPRLPFRPGCNGPVP
jgi:hypothetical protein